MSISILILILVSISILVFARSRRRDEDEGPARSRRREFLDFRGDSLNKSVFKLEIEIDRQTEREKGYNFDLNPENRGEECRTWMYHPRPNKLDVYFQYFA